MNFFESLVSLFLLIKSLFYKFIMGKKTSIDNNDGDSNSDVQTPVDNEELRNNRLKYYNKKEKPKPRAKKIAEKSSTSTSTSTWNDRARDKEIQKIIDGGWN